MAELSPVQFIDKFEKTVRRKPSLKNANKLQDLLSGNLYWIHANKREIEELLRGRNVSSQMYNFINFLINNDEKDEIKSLKSVLYGMLLNLLFDSEILAEQITQAQIPALVARDLASLQPTYMESEVSYRDIDSYTCDCIMCIFLF